MAPNQNNRYSRKQGNRKDLGSKSGSRKIVVSYIYLDRAQGQTLEDWDKKPGRLLKLNNIFQHLNSLTIQQALHTEAIVRYTKIDLKKDRMPKKSKWTYPKHLEHKEFEWCKIIVMQLVRIIGFLEDNIFYIVFLDENHEFYPTEPKNT